MKFGVDTCTWLKVFHLNSKYLQAIKVVFEKLKIFITNDVLEECLHFLSDKKDYFEKIEVLPRINRSFQEYLELGFDEADASLLEYADSNILEATRETYVVITEDPEMLRLNITGTIRIIKFIDFLILVKDFDLLDKKICRELVVHFYKTRNITKRKKEKILKELDQGETSGLQY